MRDLIQYVVELECTAGSLYADAAEYFSSDQELSRFLKDLEQDEIRHYDVMNRITDLMDSDIEQIKSGIMIDAKTWKRLEDPLIEFRERLSHGTLTEETLIDFLVAMEFSEWNNIFIYIVEGLKEYGMEFKHVVGQLENHKNKIVKFITGKPGLWKHLERVRSDKPDRKVSILVVDDEPAMINLLTSFLVKRYEVDSAMEGEEALRLISSRHYDVIISDVNMPGLSGIEIFKQAQSNDNTIGKRFIFVTGDMSPEYKRFFEQNRIFYLYKPISLDVIEDRIRTVIDRQEHPPGEGS
jgi:CheY-like chemotaxis protein